MDRRPHRRTFDALSGPAEGSGPCGQRARARRRGGETYTGRAGPMPMGRDTRKRGIPVGWFATMASRFSKGGANAVRIGVPLTVRRAKRTMSRLVLRQPLTALRPTAEALREVQRTLPMLVTASMDHYCNGPRLVRFQNSGGRQIDVDAVARMHGEAGVLGDAVSIQHMLGDIDDRRGHLGADEVGSVDCTPLAQATARALASSAMGSRSPGRSPGRDRASRSDQPGAVGSSRSTIRRPISWKRAADASLRCWRRSEAPAISPLKVLPMAMPVPLAARAPMRTVVPLPTPRHWTPRSLVPLTSTVTSTMTVRLMPNGVRPCSIRRRRPRPT